VNPAEIEQTIRTSIDKTVRVVYASAFIEHGRRQPVKSKPITRFQSHHCCFRFDGYGASSRLNEHS
jgi:hypothetical protein